MKRSAGLAKKYDWRRPKLFGNRYPFPRWFARGLLRPVLLVRGRDYGCRTSSMMQACYQAARRAQLRISIRVNEYDSQFELTVVGKRRKVRRRVGAACQS